MAYLPINSHRIPYDIDGTEVCRLNGTTYAWLSDINKNKLNNENTDALYTIGSGTLIILLFFPHVVEVTHVSFLTVIENSNRPLKLTSVQGSINSGNGVDGTWVTGLGSTKDLSNDVFAWRDTLYEVSFPSPVKTLKLTFQQATGFNSSLCSIHVYGFKADGEAPDDIAFCNMDGNRLSELMDWGDRPEGTTMFSSIKIKNTSADKIANNVNLQLNHSDFLMSWNPDGPWTSVLDISALGPGALSAPIYLKNQLAPPLLMLGPKAARIIASVGSWT